MSKSLSHWIFFAAAFLITALVYLPALRGQPVWDDLAYWIYNPEMNLSYLDYWTGFVWPVSYSAQKFMLEAFGENFLLFHLVNLTLHFVNSFLVYRLAVALAWPKPKWIFLIFLLHPANVISVAWMIQIKTLLCFLFAILSFFCFKRGLEKKRWMGAAILLFVLAMLSKSAAAPLPLLFLLYAYGKVPPRKLAWALPLVFIGLLGALLLMAKNPVMEDSVLRDSSKIQLGIQSAGYYFWQTLIPANLAPIKGRSPAGWSWSDAVFLLTLAFVAFRLYKTTIFIYMAAGFLMLAPYLGLVEAPYMAVTWVSDQHLYLALPLFLAFWFLLMEEFPRPVTEVWRILLLAIFVFTTIHASRFFANEDAFYTESLRADPGNVTVAFNYANTLAHHDRTNEALAVANGVHDLASREPLETQKHFAELENLRRQIIEFQKYKDKQKP